MSSSQLGDKMEMLKFLERIKPIENIKTINNSCLDTIGGAIKL